MGRMHGQNERWQITEKIWDKEARRLQKTRKTTAKMGGLCEERSEKGRGGRKVERKGQRKGPMERNYKSSRTAEWQLDQPHPYKRETRGRTRWSDRKQIFFHFVVKILRPKSWGQLTETNVFSQRLSHPPTQRVTSQKVKVTVIHKVKVTYCRRRQLWCTSASDGMDPLPRPVPSENIHASLSANTKHLFLFDTCAIFKK